MAEVKMPKDDLENLLRKIPLALRSKTLKKACAAGANPVQRELKKLVPKGGPRTGVKAGAPHLADLIIGKTVELPGGMAMALAGAQYPAGGHFHLVDEGFQHWRSNAQVPGKHMLATAVQRAGVKIEQKFEEVIRKAMEKP